MEKLLKELKSTNWEAAKLNHALDLMNAALYLDLVLLEAEESVGLMDGMPLLSEVAANE